ncbi:hypothetical protein NKH18_04255 [Streptomyces sp. M10(2022)]
MPAAATRAGAASSSAPTSPSAGVRYTDEGKTIWTELALPDDDEDDGGHRTG